MKNGILQGDSLEVLKTLPDECVDCVITSPPYWGLRDYGVTGQLGLEKTPEEYVAKIVAVFSEVKRALKKEGTLWLNLGDSHASTGKEGSVIKPKDLVGIPWRVAFALQADGWYLRQDIIWAKPNPMPESVTDRCTKSHEYIFLMTKSAKYYFDNEAIKEKTLTNDNSNRNRDETRLNNTPGRTKMAGLKTNDYEVRNKRSVWTVNTHPYSEAHFATFPEKLIEPMVLAGCPKEVCKKCGKARYPIMKSEYQKKEVEWHPEKYGNNDEGGARRGRMQPTGIVKNTARNVGWTDCGCNAGFTPGLVLDIFMGAGTTAVVAKKLGRQFLGIELNPAYIEIANERIAGTTGNLFAGDKAN